MPFFTRTTDALNTSADRVALVSGATGEVGQRSVKLPTPVKPGLSRPRHTLSLPALFRRLAVTPAALPLRPFEHRDIAGFIGGGAALTKLRNNTGENSGFKFFVRLAVGVHQ